MKYIIVTISGKTPKYMVARQETGVVGRYIRMAEATSIVSAERIAAALNRDDHLDSELEARAATTAEAEKRRVEDKRKKFKAV